MNPLLSFSVSSSGPGTAGAEPVAHQAGAAMDDSAGAKQFGRFLEQSGAQLTTDRQSIAAFSISGKGKRMASMVGLPAGRPDNALHPVIPPDAELILTNESDVSNLLGMLDLASQTRLQLTSEASAKTQANPDTQADATDKAALTGDTELSDKTVLSDETATVDNAATEDGKKLSKGAWFILPVYPEAAAETADSSDAEQLKKPAENTSQLTGANAAELKSAASNSDAGPAMADAADKDVSAAGQDQISAKPGEIQQARSEQSAVPAVAVAEDGDNIDNKQAAVPASAQADSSKLAATAAAKTEPATAQPAATVISGSDAPTTAAAQTAAATLSGPDTAVVMAAATEMREAAKPGPAAQTSEVIKQETGPQAAATIFDNTDNAANTTGDGAPASVLASAAAVAESSQAKQQRSGSADSFIQSKQAQLADPDTMNQQVKVDAGTTPPGTRAESALSGFGSVFSPAAQNQSEAAFARLDAATVAVTRQATERTTAQSVNKSVTEQLKQVNLLAQNAAGQLNERINLMVRQNIHVAEIRLDPADLGQMQIRVNLQQEQASVQFIVQQQHAKELLEQQMPRLREMLQQQGIQLGEGQVQQQRQGDSQASARRDGQTGNGQGGSEQHTEEQATAVQLDVKLSERIVDYYA